MRSSLFFCMSGLLLGSTKAVSSRPSGYLHQTRTAAFFSRNAISRRANIDGSDLLLRIGPSLLECSTATSIRSWSQTLPYDSLCTRCFSSKRVYSSKNIEEDKWEVPKYIPVPEDQIEFNFVRSSGAGGQNVNKVNTQVQLRFHVPSAFWIPHEVRQRLEQQEHNRISKDGYFAIAAQAHRTQVANRKEVLSKLQEILKQAWVRPKVRNMRTGISWKTKVQRKEFKRRRGDVKANRGPVDLS
jgi:protein subunit release factor B